MQKILRGATKFAFENLQKAAIVLSRVLGGRFFL